MVHMPPGYSNFRPWSNVGPRQMMMPRPTRSMMNYSYTNTGCNSCNSGLGTGGWIALGIGGVIGFLPTVLSWFGIGGGKNEVDTSVKADDTTAQAERNKTKANLETLYKEQGYTVIDQGDKFYIYKEGKQVASGTSFEEIETQMRTIIGTSGEDPKAKEDTGEILGQQAEAMKLGYELSHKDGVYTIKDKEGTILKFTGEDDKPLTLDSLENVKKALAQLKAKAEKAAQNIGDITQEQLTELQTAASAKGITDVKVTANEDGTYTVTYKEGGQDKSITAKDLADIKTQLGLSAAPIEGNRDKGEVGNDTPVQPRNKGLRLPAGWSRVSKEDLDGWGLYGPNKGYKQCNSASDVYNLMIEKATGNGYSWNSPMDPQKLTATIIRNNPSIFNQDGSVKDNANWEKLDLPNTATLEKDGFIRKEGGTTEPDKKNTLPTWATKNSKGGMTVEEIAKKLPEGKISGDATSITITFKNSHGATVSTTFTDEASARKYIVDNIPRATPANIK